MKKNAVRILLLFWVAALFGQEPGSEARDQYDLGLERIGKVATRRELQAAATLIWSALDKMPEWAEPYYALGRVEEQREVYDQAAAYYGRYLELAPAAADRAEVLARIRECRQRQARLEKDRQRMARGRWKWIMHLPPVKFNPPMASNRFRAGGDGRIEAQHPYLHQLEKRARGDSVREEWSPVTFDGRYFEYEYKVYYQALDPPRTEYTLQTVIGEIISGDPVRVRQAVYLRSGSPLFVPIDEKTLWGEVFHELR